MLFHQKVRISNNSQYAKRCVNETEWDDWRVNSLHVEHSILFGLFPSSCFCIQCLVETLTGNQLEKVPPRASLLQFVMCDTFNLFVHINVLQEFVSRFDHTCYLACCEGNQIYSETVFTWTYFHIQMYHLCNNLLLQQIWLKISGVWL